MIKRSFHPQPLPPDVAPTPALPPQRRPKVTGEARCSSCNGWGNNRNPVTRRRQTCGVCQGSGRDPRAISKP